MPDHFLTIHADEWDVTVRLECSAVLGAPCRRRPPEDDYREEWDADDPDLVDGKCWAVEWFEAADWEGTQVEGEFPRIPVKLSYSDGPVLTAILAPDTAELTALLEDAEARAASAEAEVDRLRAAEPKIKAEALREAAEDWRPGDSNPWALYTRKRLHTRADRIAGEES